MLYLRLAKLFTLQAAVRVARDIPALAPTREVRILTENKSLDYYKDKKTNKDKLLKYKLRK